MDETAVDETAVSTAVDDTAELADLAEPQPPHFVKTQQSVLMTMHLNA